MSSTVLLIGALIMIGVGFTLIIATKESGYASWVAVGLGLMWIGMAVKP